MKTLKYLLILISLSLYVPANGNELILTDVMVVIDNSASMKKNDPGFLLKQALTKFVDNLQGDTYTGFILFSDNVDMVMPLKPLKNDSAQIKLEMVTNLINYSGMHTSIPAAIEKAFYELKVNGRKGSDKLIILLTDGIVDIPDNAKNDEKSRWLKEVITEDCKNEKIKIFSIAFTEQADFELLQTLSSKTGGSYYRALNASDISKVFLDITAVLNIKAEQKETIVEPSVPETKAVTVYTKSPAESSYKVFIIVVTSIFLLAIIATAIFTLYIRKRKRPEMNGEDLPEAYLVDISGITNKSTFQIRKRITRIGRATANDLYIPDEKNFISSFHAIIEYIDNNFYIVDQDSVNGTFVNGNKIEKKEKILLKGGDEIAFDKFGFKFLCPAEGERGQTVLNIGGSNTGSSTIQHIPETHENTDNSNTTE